MSEKITLAVGETFELGDKVYQVAEESESCGCNDCAFFALEDCSDAPNCSGRVFVEVPAP